MPSIKAVSEIVVSDKKEKEKLCIDVCNATNATPIIIIKMPGNKYMVIDNSQSPSACYSTSKITIPVSCYLSCVNSTHYKIKGRFRFSILDKPNKRVKGNADLDEYSGKLEIKLSDPVKKKSKKKKENEKRIDAVPSNFIYLITRI